MANVFISHRSSDNQEAEQLGREIRSVGHDVWIDVWKINLGDSIIEQIDAGLKGASYVIICYSASGIDSPWMSREWMSSLARQLNGRAIKLLPVLLTGGEPPAILADIKYGNLTQDWQLGIAELLRAIK